LAPDTGKIALATNVWPDDPNLARGIVAVSAARVTAAVVVRIAEVCVAPSSSCGAPMRRVRSTATGAVLNATVKNERTNAVVASGSVKENAARCDDKDATVGMMLVEADDVSPVPPLLTAWMVCLMVETFVRLPADRLKYREELSRPRSGLRLIARVGVKEYVVGYPGCCRAAYPQSIYGSPWSVPNAMTRGQPGIVVL
jgi:hypothetical protein